ncbi:5'(3')-deoxyribonucleotidase [Flavobacteriaceae bacterium MAR_2010_188]|nr:5'(3')-deoxyribonucleotidase [Flavobacteriaceae bacterium MAR_2010_188]
MNKPLTIFVDMDEVMADTYYAHIDQYNKDFDECLTPEDCWGKEVWKAVPEHRNDTVKNHAYGLGFFSDLKPIKDSQKVLEAINEKHDVYIASAAMQFPNSLLEKSEWLDQHFPFIPWQKRILCGDKHILKGDVLIDDRGYNLKTFDGRKFLFTSGHNIHETEFERVDSWQDVANKLL